MLIWLAGLAMAALLLMSPEAAVNGAREAMAQWVYSVAPALFPFMALLPLLTCDAALEAYERLLGGLTRRLYDLPGGAAPALAVGILAGSPAGCAAVKRVAARTPVTRGQARRLAIACCGLSPAFLITGIGAALLGDVSCGHILLRSQIAVQLTLPLLLRPLCRDSTPMPVRESEDATPPVLAILNVCGYMVLFGAVAAALGRVAGERLGRLCLLTLDVTSGTRIICAMAMPLRLRPPVVPTPCVPAALPRARPSAGPSLGRGSAAARRSSVPAAERAGSSRRAAVRAPPTPCRTAAARSPA